MTSYLELRHHWVLVGDHCLRPNHGQHCHIHGVLSRLVPAPGALQGLASHHLRTQTSVSCTVRALHIHQDAVEM